MYALKNKYADSCWGSTGWNKINSQRLIKRKKGLINKRMLYI